MAFATLSRLLSGRRRSRHEPRWHKIRGFKIQLPPRHTLPTYQAQHRLYDHFLGVLGDCLPDGSLIIDIGANVGDSVAAVCGTGCKRVVCVEGSPHFFPILRKNAKVIEAAGHRVRCVNAIVGPEGAFGRIEEGESTGKIVLSKYGRSLRSLDRILAAPELENARPTLIKVDSDGYDAAIIMSGKRAITAYRPLLYWENEVLTPESLNEYLHFYEFLRNIGYSWYTVFDNFGNVMFDTDSLFAVCGIARYTATLNKHLSTRTIYYADILASIERDRSLHEQSIKVYKRQFGLDLC